MKVKHIIRLVVDPYKSLTELACDLKEKLKNNLTGTSEVEQAEDAYFFPFKRSESNVEVGIIEGNSIKRWPSFGDDLYRVVVKEVEKDGWRLGKVQHLLSWFGETSWLNKAIMVVALENQINLSGGGLHSPVVYYGLLDRKATVELTRLTKFGTSSNDLDPSSTWFIVVRHARGIKSIKVDRIGDIYRKITEKPENVIKLSARLSRAERICILCKSIKFMLSRGRYEYIIEILQKYGGNHFQKEIIFAIKEAQDWTGSLSKAAILCRYVVNKRSKRRLLQQTFNIAGKGSGGHFDDLAIQLCIAKEMTPRMREKCLEPLLLENIQEGYRHCVEKILPVLGRELTEDEERRLKSVECKMGWAKD